MGWCAVRGLEKPLSGATYRKEITSGLSWTFSGETRVVGRISEHPDKHVFVVTLPKYVPPPAFRWEYADA